MSAPVPGRRTDHLLGTPEPWYWERDWPANVRSVAARGETRLAVNWLQPHTKREVWQALKARDPAGAERLKAAMANPDIRGLVERMGATLLIEDPRA